MLEKIEASAGFVKLDLKIQGRRQLSPYPGPSGSGTDTAFVKSPIKQAEPPLSLASREAEGAGARRPFILSIPQLRCRGAEGATEARRGGRCACCPNDSRGCLIKPRESEFSSLFISYKCFFCPLKDLIPTTCSSQPARFALKAHLAHKKGEGRAGVLQEP